MAERCAYSFQLQPFLGALLDMCIIMALTIDYMKRLRAPGHISISFGESNLLDPQDFLNICEITGKGRGCLLFGEKLLEPAEAVAFLCPLLQLPGFWRSELYGLEGLWRRGWAPER